MKTIYSQSPFPNQKNVRRGGGTSVYQWSPSPQGKPGKKQPTNICKIDYVLEGYVTCGYVQ